MRTFRITSYNVCYTKLLRTSGECLNGRAAHFLVSWRQNYETQMNHLLDSEKYMQRCLQLAQLAEGKTYPNPMVGSVIVHKGKIIGEGYHRKAGEPHAEVNAVNSVKEQSLLKESTLYVNLEPCA